MAQKYGYGPEKVTISGCTSPEQLARDPSIHQHVSVAFNIEEILKYLYLEEKSSVSDADFRILMSSPWERVRSLELTDERIDSIIHYVKLLGVHSLNLPHRLLTDTLINVCQTADVPLSVWTVNEKEVLHRCLQAGVENITTTQVRLALQCMHT